MKNKINKISIKNKLNNFKDKTISFFKNPKEVISFFLPIIITICLLIPVPFYIKMGGGTIKIDNKINIEDSYRKDGSFEALYVKEAKGVVLTYLLSYIIPSYEKEKIENVTYENEDVEDYNYRESLYFTSSLDAATKVAFEKAGKEVSVSSSKFLVLYIEKRAKTNLEVGDEILKVDGIPVSSYEEMSKLIENKKIGETVNVLVKRDRKEIVTTSALIDFEGIPKLGIVLSNEIKYKSNPEVDFKFNGRQAGPSGGLMISLSIYNKLVEDDITKGRKIVGTGTIDLEGNVGEIGGVKHKLMAANKKNADVVFVPKGNYKEAKKYKDKEKYDFALVSVSTFDEAVEYLTK